MEADAMRPLYYYGKCSPLIDPLLCMWCSFLGVFQHIEDGYQRGMISGAAFVYLSPILFNIYINDQSLHGRTRNFIYYANNLCVTAPYPSFTEVEHTIEEVLDELTTYYRSISLSANPDKTQVTSFHLKTQDAKRTSKFNLNNTDLENTLDRTLSYKQHIHNTKMKVATLNNS